MPALSHDDWPCPSKYKVVDAPNCIPNRKDFVHVFGVARRSATTAVVMFAAAVWEVALRFVSTATGTKPNTAIKQKAAIPIARVTSIKENPGRERSARSHLIDFNISAEAC
jgi:hypothetical protein